MADKYIARVKTTTALALAGLGDGHTAIVTDGLYEHVHRIGSNYHFLTADKYWNGAAYNYNDRTFGAVTTLGDINIPNAESINAKNAAGSAYRKLIGLDASNVLKIGQDTDIAAVTFGTTSELARLNSSGLGVGCTPTVMLHAESATTTEMLLKNTGDNAVNLFFDADRTTGYGRGVGYLYGKWAGNTVTRIGFITGADDTNKDDGWILFSTATGGSLTQKMLLGYQLPIVEIGNPTTEDDAAVWANTQTVLRVGTGLSILDFQSSGISYPELLWNAQCSNPGITYKARQTGRSYRLRGDCANNTGVLSIDFVANQTAGDTLTWLTALNIGGAAIRHNPNSSDIDFAFYGDNRQVAQLDAGTDTFQFFDYNGVAAQWFATATPTNGFLRFNTNKSLYFNTECQMFADGTYMYIQGNNLPDDAHKVTNYLYRDNGGYIKVA